MVANLERNTQAKSELPTWRVILNVGIFAIILPPKKLEIQNHANGSTLQVREAERIALTCISRHSKPAAKLKWYRNGVLLQGVAVVAEWYRYRTVACLVTSLIPVPLKTRRVGLRCTLNLSRAETSSRWCCVVFRRERYQLRCRPRHLTMVQNIVVRRHKSPGVAEQCDVNIQSIP
ncbi:uncharacterized protein TNCV_3566031 [Trichonephila clavipes]|nr:uncharacterized protein TNCV_3566031 [Trichonephila clavipes]